ncbi:hypothetical protein F6Q07_01780 [Pectobacterium parmentieri]|uniref:Uncharacterized protein n=2 Tax=Pectobacterium parmentieri TaxID=1905730 RepID=A0A8B3FWV1_PECPM|nr:hypothetical protein [Pectobacterium parmentieri]ACX88355.1 hypothetical protein Pecwa_2599 [Pectobacterium parmentieri WPP163]AOR58393.1 hypothetical protein A8F97_05685 [Pectobacterium parmentieri]AYH01780.1 hypothetical protein C5E26_13005 [Pectobacterium parmentieri]AYH06047.1 hypothetical protein C5E25_12165 [Pectobacterium parmentieri]AYH10597.1 hypothetical protein C5E24_13345 [Pectobacterium parmentieri]
MEQKNTTVERLEKELQGKIRAKKWVFFGGFATAISAFLELYSNPYDDSTYPYAQLLLAVVCFGYGVSLLYNKKKLETALAALRSEAKGPDETLK